MTAPTIDADAIRERAAKLGSLAERQATGFKGDTYVMAVALAANLSAADVPDLLTALDQVTARLAQAEQRITDQEQQLRDYHKRVTHDSLTDVLNRDGLAERWQGRDIDQHDALAVLDLDNFKQVNDTYGHAAGDRVLRHVARDLADRYHVVARLSGDELAIVDGRGRLGDLVRCPLAWQVPLSAAFTLMVTASVGIARCTAPLNLVQARADAALYDAKNAQRGTARWFELRRHPHLRTAEGIEARPAVRLRDTRAGVAR